MRIVCPKCGAGYDVPVERLSAGRPVRCARCAEQWVPPALELAPDPVVAAAQAAERQAPVGPDVEPAEVGPVPFARIEPLRVPAADYVAPSVGMPIPEVRSPMQRMVPAVTPGRARFILPAAWVLSIAVIGALGWAAVARRTAVIRAWPPSERAYAVIGLAAPDRLVAAPAATAPSSPVHEAAAPVGHAAPERPAH